MGHGVGREPALHSSASGPATLLDQIVGSQRAASAINAAHSRSAGLCYNSWMGEPQSSPALTRFRAAVAEIYGARLDRVVLFGSRARGDAKPDSDYDVAVFIKDAGGFGDESARLAAVTTDILLDTGAVISATPFPCGAYRKRTGFMHELRKDGLVL